MDPRPVFFFDVDDCLYPRSIGVTKIMSELLEKFVMETLSITREQATQLNEAYFKEHTLTVIGLQRLHQVDPLVFNDKVDNALPLDDLLFPDAELRATLQKFDTEKVKLWLLTNAHVTHGQRVARLLGVDDLFEGITYCDYSTGLWPLKPHSEMFAKAEREAGAVNPDQCYFVDDSPRNCEAALARGWHVIQIIDPKLQTAEPARNLPYFQIGNLSDIHNIFPQFSR